MKSVSFEIPLLLFSLCLNCFDIQNNKISASSNKTPFEAQKLNKRPGAYLRIYGAFLCVDNRSKNRYTPLSYQKLAYKKLVPG